MPIDSKTIVNRRVNPLLYNLPSWVASFRSEQIRAVTDIVRAFEDSRLVVLDAPTGSGKTLIGETVRLLLRSTGLYVCSSLGLQDQFARDFGYSKVVKGRSNYRTESYPQRYPIISCDDCQWTQDSPQCAYCERKATCPYEISKNAAIRSNLAVVNSAYALTEWNGPGRFSGRQLVVIDEADEFEKAVVNHVSVGISSQRMAQFGWKTPKKVTVPECWTEWLADHIPRCERLLDAATVEKESKYLGRLLDRMRVVEKHLGEGMPYAYTGDDRRLEFKPASVSDYCEEAVWRHGEKFLLMSATTISSGSMLRGLGWKNSSHTTTLRSSFPIENRPVVVKPVANMSRRTRDEEYPRLEETVRGLIDSEPGRVLVHAVSYSMAKALSDSLSGGGRPVFSYGMASDRATAISQYVRTPGGILVAPTADRGVDLPDDLCRLCIISKVPYPDLGDRMVRLRMGLPDGQEWYTASTVRGIVQMAGRGVRHKEDYCRTVILDSQFGRGIWLRGRVMFPEWFKEAMIWER